MRRLGLSKPMQPSLAQRRIVITGVGLAAPGASNLADFRANLLAGKSGVTTIDLRYMGKHPAGICQFAETRYRKKRENSRGTRAGCLGVYCANDMTAIGLIDEIQARGYSVPGDFSVCGFDNIFTSAICTPQLTTIDHHLQVRCKAAVDQITARRRELSEAMLPPVINKVEYSPRLVVRASTGPAREGAAGRKREKNV